MCWCRKGSREQLQRRRSRITLCVTTPKSSVGCVTLRLPLQEHWLPKIVAAFLFIMLWTRQKPTSSKVSLNESTTHSRRGHPLVCPWQREVASLMSQHLSVQVRVRRNKCPCCTQSVASVRGALQDSLLCGGLLALSGGGDVAPFPPVLFLNNPLLQALGLVEEKPGKQEHGRQHKAAQHHQPHVAAMGKRGHSGLLCRDHVGQVQHVAKGPACITAANLKRERSRISGGRCRGCFARAGASLGKRTRLCSRGCSWLWGYSPSHHKTHLSKEVDTLPVFFSEFIAIFQEREDVGPREAIFTQVLFFYVVVC